MKWILKKMIVALIEVLVVMGLLDLLGIDVEGLLGGLLGDDSGSTEDTEGDSTDVDTSVEA